MVTFQRMFAAMLLFLFVFLYSGVGANANVGDLLYPRRSVNENIDHLESAAKRLIASFGKTVDEQTLQLLMRTVQAIDSLKIAYKDSLHSTFERISTGRQEAFFAVAATLQEVDQAVSKNIGEVSEIEKRLSNTLIRLSRGSQAPWLLSYSPVGFLEGRPTALTVRISGQNIQHPESKLLLGDREFVVQTAHATIAEFILPREVLRPGSDGLVHAKLLLVSSEPSAFWEFWKSREVVEYTLLFRPLSSRVGTYSVQSRIVDVSSIGQSISQDSASYTTEVRGKGKSATQEHCLHIRDLDLDGRWEFETAKTVIITKGNARHGKHSICNAAAGFSFQLEGVDCSRTSYPNASPKLTVNNPDKLCMELNATTAVKSHDFRSANVEAFFRYSRHRTAPSSHEFSGDGELFWNEDRIIQLPDGHQGFRLEFLFEESGERRVFFGPDSYGPIQVKFDPNSRAIAIRAIIK